MSVANLLPVRGDPVLVQPADVARLPRPAHHHPPRVPGDVPARGAVQNPMFDSSDGSLSLSDSDND